MSQNTTVQLLAKIQKQVSDDLQPVKDLKQKGKILVGNGTNASNLSTTNVSNGYVLTVDSNKEVGVKWAAAPNPFNQSLNTNSDVTFHNLNVDGTATIYNSVEVVIDDSLQKLGNNNMNDKVDSGWYACYDNTKFCGIHRKHGTDVFKFYSNLTVEPINNVIDESYYMPATLEANKINLVGSTNGNLTSLMSHNTPTNNWTLTMPVSTSNSSGQSLVSSDTLGSTQWSDRVSQLSLGAGMKSREPITTTGTLETDNSTLPYHTLPISSNDLLSVYDIITSTQSKANISQIQSVLDHNSLSNYDQNKHIDHSTINVIAGTSLENADDLTVLTGNVTINHSDMLSGSPGTYTHSTVTVDAQGHITAISSGSPVTSVSASDLSGLNICNITTTGSLNVDISNSTPNSTPLSSNLLMTQKISNGILEKTTISELNSRLDHNSMSNYSNNRHIDHSSISVLGSNSGLAVSTNNLTSNIGLIQDINTLNALGSSVATDDLVPIYNVSSTSTRKATIQNLESAINHNALANYNVNKHVDHSLISILGSNSGLAVNNNDLTSNIGLVLDINSLSALGTNVTRTDLLSIYDESSATTRKATITNFEQALNHDNLSGFVVNEHIDHSAINLSTSITSGLDVGGTISANLTASRALRFRPNLLTVEDTLDKNNDTLVFHDNSANGARKTSISNFESKLNHNALSNFESNKHIDHTTVNITTDPDSGLIGGGHIGSSRSLSVDINGTTTESNLDLLTDKLLFWDSSEEARRSLLLCDLNSAMDHDIMMNYTINDHIDHTTVLFQAANDSGLLINGTNSTVNMTSGTKQLSIDISGTTPINPTLLDLDLDKVLMKDSNGSGSGLRSIAIRNLMGAQLHLGTVATGVTAINMGSAFNKTTKLTLGSSTSFTLSVSNSGNGAMGRLLYTFPTSGSSGIVLHSILANVVCSGTGIVNNNTPEIGVGTSIASGSISSLSSNSTFENILYGNPSLTSVNGATSYKINCRNISNTSMGIYLNMAGNWSGADTITCTGSLTINWTYLP